MGALVSGRWSGLSLPVAGPAHSTSVSTLPAQFSSAASARKCRGCSREHFAGQRGGSPGQRPCAPSERPGHWSAAFSCPGTGRRAVRAVPEPAVAAARLFVPVAARSRATCQKPRPLQLLPPPGEEQQEQQRGPPAHGCNKPTHPHPPPPRASGGPRNPLRAHGSRGTGAMC